MELIKSEIGWVKFPDLQGFSALGMHSILIAGNSWLKVINVNAPYKRDIYQADEGVQVAAGHRHLPCIVYAQKNNQPLVSILVYPGFKVIRTIPGLKNDKYLFVDFCDLEILVAMIQNAEAVEIKIWNWRTGEKIAVLPSAIQDPKQNISLSWTSPVQFMEWNSQKMVLWHLHVSGQKYVTSKNEIVGPLVMKSLVKVTWTAEGDCMVFDPHFGLFTVNFDTGALQKEVNFPIFGLETPMCFVWSSQGIITSVQDRIHFFKKQENDWIKSFTVTNQPTVNVVVVVNSVGKETFIGWSKKNTIFSIKNEKNGPEVYTILYFDGRFDKICLIKPEATRFLTHQTGEKIMTVWDLKTGSKLTEIEIPESDLLVMTSTDEGMVILGFSAGFIEILDFSSWLRYHLHPCRQPIDDIQFSTEGFAVCSREAGDFYYYQKQTDEQWDVSAYMNTDYKVDQFILCDQPEINLFVLSTSALNKIGGNAIRVYGLSDETFVLNKAAVFNQFYTQMTHCGDTIIMVPFRSRDFHILDKLSLEKKRQVRSGHLIPLFKVLVLGSTIVSYGADGLINTYDGPVQKYLLTFHRTDGGVTLFDAGKHGFLAGAANGCFVYKTTGSDGLIAEDLRKFRVVQEEVDETWLEKWETEKRLEIFEAERNTRMDLLTQFEDVKQKIKNLLDANELLPDDEKLPVSEFELNLAGRSAIAEEEELLRTEIYEREVARMRVQDELSARIIESTWNLMKTRARELFPIFTQGADSVHCYALLPEGDVETALITERRKLLNDLHAKDYLRPWLPGHEQQSWNQESRISSVALESLDLKIRLPFQSTSTHFFLPERVLPHSQLQVHTLFLSNDIIATTDRVIRKLMIWFNKEFETASSEKGRELRSLTDRRDRLRQIAEELTELGASRDLLPDDIPAAHWSPTEQPESFLTVTDAELVEPPYLTQEELEKQRQAEKEEEIRLEKLRADDFRERALHAMMDGVLEKKWQDEIKKDELRPVFMDEKKPEEWTDDENRRAKMYQDGVEKLRLERERYKMLLVAEFKQLAASAQETGSRFDNTLKQLKDLKLRIESAICQEQLNILRMRMEIMERISLSRKEEKLSAAISEGENKLEILLDEATKLQDALSETRALLESLLTRDKNMDKNLKKEFPEYSPIIFELLNKLSKKRPKLQGRGSNNAALLNELGRYVVQADDRTHRLPMPQECVEYLKGLDQLDGAVNTPALVNENSWETLCRLRRAKIDSELKIRAVGIDLAETEQTAIQWQKMIKGCRETISRKQAELEGLLNAKRMNELDCTVQIVVPQRIVEVAAITGKLSDYSGAVLVSRVLIDEVNQAIQNAGEQKVSAMEKACEFRKGVIYKEWEHQKLRLLVDDLKAQLDTLEHFHVTKELQEILNARARGDYVEKGFANLEKQIHAVNVRFQRAELGILQTIDDYEQKIANLDYENNELDSRIVSLNKLLGKRTQLRDLTAEQNAEKEAQQRMNNIARHGRLVMRTQELASELAALQAEKDLLCLKAYPTLSPN